MQFHEPAFPSAEESGVTVGAYLIAHAPGIPEWFVPNIPPKPKEVWVHRDTGEVIDFTHPAFHSTMPRILKNAQEISDWEFEYVKERTLQWPAYWALEQLRIINQLSS
jgi:hypothetical protein